LLGLARLLRPLLLDAALLGGHIVVIIRIIVGAVLGTKGYGVILGRFVALRHHDSV
jgi:hypothetical protein